MVVMQIKDQGICLEYIFFSRKFLLETDVPKLFQLYSNWCVNVQYLWHVMKKLKTLVL